MELVDRNLIKGIFNRRPHKNYNEDGILIKSSFVDEEAANMLSDDFNMQRKAFTHQTFTTRTKILKGIQETQRITNRKPRYLTDNRLGSSNRSSIRSNDQGNTRMIISPYMNQESKVGIMNPK